MKRYFNFIIFIVGMSCAMSYNIPKNDTKYDEIDYKSTQNSTSNNITVHTEMETGKTMTDPLGQDGELSEGRTFAANRLQFMLLPIMYKAGVMTTLLVIVVVLSLKSFLIGFLLLIIKLSGFLAKFHHEHHEHHETPSHPPTYLWAKPPEPQPPIHVHLYNADNHHHPHDHHSHDHHTHEHHVDYEHIDHQPYSKLDHMPTPFDPYQNAIAMDRRGQYIAWNH